MKQSHIVYFILSFLLIPSILNASEKKSQPVIIPMLKSQPVIHLKLNHYPVINYADETKKTANTVMDADKKVLLRTLILYFALSPIPLAAGTGLIYALIINSVVTNVQEHKVPVVGEREIPGFVLGCIFGSGFYALFAFFIVMGAITLKKYNEYGKEVKVSWFIETQSYQAEVIRAGVKLDFK